MPRAKPQRTAAQIQAAAENARAPETTVKVGSARTVTVGCKLPNGLILRLHREEKYDEPVMGGGTKERVRFVDTGEHFKLNGVAIPFGKAPNYLVVDGYALTSNVPADFWRQWLSQNQSLDAVKNRVVIAHESPDHVTGEARDRKDERSGLEPLNPGRKILAGGKSVPIDPRYPRSVRPEVSDLETADVR